MISKEYNFQEKVRSLNLDDFKSMFKQSKIEILHIFGDYKLNDFDINILSIDFYF